MAHPQTIHWCTPTNHLITYISGNIHQIIANYFPKYLFHSRQSFMPIVRVCKTTKSVIFWLCVCVFYIVYIFSLRQVITNNIKHSRKEAPYPTGSGGGVQSDCTHWWSVTDEHSLNSLSSGVQLLNQIVLFVWYALTGLSHLWYPGKNYVEIQISGPLIKS